MKTVRVFGDYRVENLGWLFGSSDPKIVSGVVTWAGIILVGFAVHRLTRHRTGLYAFSGTVGVAAARGTTDG
jgi:hypothetical protein